MGHQYTGTNVYPSDYTIPDDGDTLEVVSVNVAFEALGDRTTYLNERQGPFRPASNATLGHEPLLLDPPASFLSVGGTAVNEVDIIASDGFVFIGYNGDPQTGDLVEIEFSGYLIVDATSASAANYLTTIILRSSQNGGASAVIPKAKAFFAAPYANGDVFDLPFCVRGVQTVTAGGAYIVSAAFSIAGDTDLALQCPVAQVTLKIWRAT